jgi:CHAT domain-containing protein/tetratricopeptide (TPR) repeat protein
VAPLRSRCSLSLPAALAALACGVASSCAAGSGPERIVKRRSTPRAEVAARAVKALPAPVPITRVFQLAMGAGVERELAGGMVDAYEIDLTLGQYLYATFDQRGIDIVVRVFGPGLVPLFEVDRPYDDVGAEQVYLVAETSGRYRLEVTSFKRDARGRYLARVEALRPARRGDRRRVAAERALSETRDWPRRAPGFLEAVAKLEKARRLFAELGARDRQAEACYQLGKRHLLRRDYREALELFQSANVLYRGLRDHRFIAVTYNEIGRAHAEMGEYDRALPPYRRALAEWRRQPLADGHAVTLENLGELDALQGKTAAALRLYREASELWHRRGEPSEHGKEANALTHLAWVYRTVGAWSQALTVLGPALELCRGPGEQWQRAKVLKELAKVYLNEDEPRRALPYLEQAYRLEPSGGDPEALAGTLVDLGVSYRRLHEYARSLQFYADALRIFQQTGNRQAEAITWLSLGSAYLRLHQPARAAQLFGKALRMAHDTGLRATEAAALLGAGLAARDRGNLGEALANGEAALAMVEALRGAASRPDLRASYLALNEDRYGFLVEVLMQMHAEQPARGFDLRALQYSEQARARNLLDDLVARGARPAGSSVDPALVAERRRLERQIAAKDRELHEPAAPGHPGAKAVALQIEQLVEQLSEVADRISKRGVPAAPPPRAGALPRSVAEIARGLLDDKTLLLEYYLGAAKSYLWAITPEAVASFELPGREELDPLLRSTHQLLSRSRQPENQDAAARRAAELSRILLGQVATRLGERRLVIIANGALQYTPFAALPDPGHGGEPLMLRHEIVYAPSLAVLAELRAGERPRSSAPGLVAIVADPVFGTHDERTRGLRVPAAMLDPQLANLQRLPYSHAEAEAIASLAGREGVLEALGFDANAGLVTSGRLRHYRILHFATHGMLRTDPSDLPALALSQIDRDGQPREGFLRAFEIADLELPADLVVLSGCETALGKELAGEGLIGLPRAFMSAGARRVLVSLWDVGDRSTAALMHHFYHHLLARKLPPAAALRAAQRAMWQEAQWRAPCYWGGFVLQGDWR